MMVRRNPPVPKRLNSLSGSKGVSKPFVIAIIAVVAVLVLSLLIMFSDKFVGEAVKIRSSNCGNVQLDQNEECDDGKHCVDGTPCTDNSKCDKIMGNDLVCKARSGDGCSLTCKIEEGYKCSAPSKDKFNNLYPSVCAIKEPGLCGNSLFEPNYGEQCDSGHSYTTIDCTPACKLNICGDGFSCAGKPCEECDDGNIDSTDGCSAQCIIEPNWDCVKACTLYNEKKKCLNYKTKCTLSLPLECGDGILNPKNNEACDDGNTAPNDGCSASCTQESTWNVMNGFNCGHVCTLYDENKNCLNYKTVCTPVKCGNGKVEVGEACDDGNNADNDGCSATCTVEAGICGNKVVEQKLGEECDDGNKNDADSCLASCKLNKCGDGSFYINKEGCDDGNEIPGDGCSATCTKESTWNVMNGFNCGHVCTLYDENKNCLNYKTVCTPVKCGNGKVEAGEECDDGNLVKGDGCDGCKNEIVVELLGDTDNSKLIQTKDAILIERHLLNIGTPLTEEEQKRANIDSCQDAGKDLATKDAIIIKRALSDIKLPDGINYLGSDKGFTCSKV